MNFTATALAVPAHPVAAPTRIRPLYSAFDDDLLQAVAVTDDLRAGLAKAVTVLRRDYAKTASNGGPRPPTVPHSGSSFRPGTRPGRAPRSP
jgi:hypothetical protein